MAILQGIALGKTPSCDGAAVCWSEEEADPQPTRSTATYVRQPNSPSIPPSSSLGRRNEWPMRSPPSSTSVRPRPTLPPLPLHPVGVATLQGQGCFLAAPRTRKGPREVRIGGRRGTVEEGGGKPRWKITALSHIQRTGDLFSPDDAANAIMRSSSSLGFGSLDPPPSDRATEGGTVTRDRRREAEEAGGGREIETGGDGGDGRRREAG